jgi:hypothetical protein
MASRLKPDAQQRAFADIRIEPDEMYPYNVEDAIARLDAPALPPMQTATVI